MISFIELNIFIELFLNIILFFLISSLIIDSLFYKIKQIKKLYIFYLKILLFNIF